MRDVTCVVLAAGRGTRMGREKLTLPFGAGSMLEAVLEACAGRPTVVVTSSAVAASPSIQERLATGRFDLVANDAPERGMAHSLRLAHHRVAPSHALAVLLGDKPLVGPALLQTLLDAREADVVYPSRRGVGGHPVIFSLRARALIDGLPEGDTLQQLRDDPRLTRFAVPIDDEGAFVDVDTEEDYARALGRQP